jgi:hypothetical protein
MIPPSEPEGESNKTKTTTAAIFLLIMDALVVWFMIGLHY